MPPESEIDTLPATLKPDPNTPVPADISTLSPKDAVRQREDEWNTYLASIADKGEVSFSKTTGQVKIKTVGVSEKDKAIAEGITDPVQRAQYLAAAGEDSASVVDDMGSRYLSNLNEAELNLKRAAEDAAEAKKLQGSVKSYAASEQDKSAEITRQFKDFDARADSLYDLMDAEQSYGMNADDQNIQNMKAQKDLGMAIMPGGYYTKPYMSGSLSSILAPSLPDYVRPDYRQNASVGLPGPQGFDDPDYSSSGLPMYAAGTDPQKPREIFWPWRNQ